MNWNNLVENNVVSKPKKCSGKFPIQTKPRKSNFP